MDHTRKLIKLQGKNDSAKINTLGDDLIVEILVKLPVKSLLRCRSVCKNWYAVTKTDFFISTHFLDHQYYRSDRNNHHPLFLSRVLSINNDSSNFTIRLPVGLSLLCDEKEKLPPLRLPFVPKDKSDWFMLFGSSNGLVCLSVRVRIYKLQTLTHVIQDIFYLCGSYQHTVIVWNPATEQYRRLPKHITNCNIPFVQDDGSDRIPLIGFDFVRNSIGSSDYKVVRIFRHKSADDRKWTFRAQVFDQNTDSWRLVKNEVDQLGYPCNSREYTSITIKGVLYWKISGDLQEEYWRYSIMSFDLREEIFNEIRLPTKVQGQVSGDWGWHKLFSWNNSLASLAYDSDVDIDEPNLVLWVLTSSNQNKSVSDGVWTPQFKLKNYVTYNLFPNGPDVHLGIWKDQFLFACISGGSRDKVNINVDEDDDDESYMSPRYLFTYDPETHKTTEVLEHKEKIDVCGARLNCVSYVESMSPV